MASQNTARATTGSNATKDPIGSATKKCFCPACGGTPLPATIERYGKYELLGCEQCGLQYWEPRKMPGADWYEQMYGGRDQAVLPLEPGH